MIKHMINDELNSKELKNKFEFKRIEYIYVNVQEANTLAEH